MASTLEDILGSWQSGLSPGEQETWDQRMRSALDERWTASGPDLQLDEDRSWALLGWCESATSTAVRASDLELLELCVLGLSLVSQRHVDHREVALVGSLVRRAVELAGGSWLVFRGLFVGRRSLLNLLDGFPEEVSPASHREYGAGRAFRFEKLRLAQMTEEELLRRLNRG